MLKCVRIVKLKDHALDRKMKATIETHQIFQIYKANPSDICNDNG